MLNALPLNAAPLNGGGPAGSSPSEPVYVVAGISYVWQLRVLVGGLDVTGQLTGSITVDREEGAAGIADFGLYLPESPVVPTDWIGKRVEIDYISTSQGDTTQVRRFTGQMSQPTWNPVTRILRCECSDQLQQRVEAMSIETIDGLVQGAWSEDVFEPTLGRSHWDYALERMDSRTASLDCSPAGDMRVTSWYATAPQFEFGTGTTIYQSLDVQLSELSNITNRVEIEVSYRYPRLAQLLESFNWAHPNAEGLSGLNGFCEWRTWSTELPDTDMITGALTGSGLGLIGQVSGSELPLSMPNPCGDGNPWINSFRGLWLSASVSGGRRWVQSVTESYKLTLTTVDGQSDSSQRIARSNASFEIESSKAEEWSDSIDTAPNDQPGDLGDDGRRHNALDYLLRRGQADIVEAHRGSTVSWSVPASMALTVDLVHTLMISDQGARAVGKCRRVQDSFNLESGEALTTLSIAVMRGGGVSDALTVPAAPDTSLAPLSGASVSLPTQLGGRILDPYTQQPMPPYDEAKLGFSGNYSAKDQLTAEDFPRRFDLEARDIPAEYRDERTATAEATYMVGIPNDLLEL